MHHHNDQKKKRVQRSTQESLDELEHKHPEYFTNKDAPKRRLSTSSNVARNILRSGSLSLLGGPFHYSLRAGTYGDPWDEIPWKVRLGLTEPKERFGFGDNPSMCAYEPRVLVSNWYEDRSDRDYIKYRGPRLSQYGHHYVSEYSRKFSKPVCNKEKDVLLTMSRFPMSCHPGHQPELNTDTLRFTADKPEGCEIDERVGECQKEMERQKRYFKDRAFLIR